MGWPLVGRQLSDLNALLSNWGQYTTFPFIGAPDDINRLYNVLLAVGVTGVSLDDVGNRPQYWLLRLSTLLGDTINILQNGEGLIQVSVNPESNSGLEFFGTQFQLGTRIQLLDTVSPNDIRIAESTGIIEIFSDTLTNFLQEQTGLTITNNPDLVSVSLPHLRSQDDGNLSPFLDFSSNLNLSEVDVSSYVPQNFETTDLSNCALSAQTVNLILRRWALTDNGNGTINLAGGTSSSPTGQGVVDKQDLEDRGINVSTN